MTEQKEKKITPAKLRLLTRAFLILISCVGVYLLNATHFVFCVRAAHFLGDVSYIPPSILRYTSIIFQQGEIEAGAQIIFFILWLILVVVSAALLAAISFAVIGLSLLFTSDESISAAICDSLFDGILAILPVILLSLLTLLTMPLESTHPSVDSTSLTQIGEMLLFSDFLYTMTQATVVISVVCLFVILTCVIVYFLSFILPDNSFFFFVSMFIGVCVGVAIIMLLGDFLYKGMGVIRFLTGSSYLTHYAIYGIYSFFSALLILPSWLRDKDKIEIETKRERVKFRKSKTIAAVS